jgi:hypothetical protein
VPLTITRAQRDAIYEMVVNHLTAIGDVWISVDRHEFATAKRMGREFREDLRLLEDLGWAETIDGETVALTVPPGELTRTLARLHKDAAGSLGTYVSRPKNDEELAERDLAASEALGEILSQLAHLKGAIISVACHAASRWYSWMRPPRRSWRWIAPVVAVGGGSGGCGGWSLSARCGLCVL